MSDYWVEKLMDLVGQPFLPIEDLYAALRLKRRHFPKSLFKYRAVTDYALKNLRDSTLYLSPVNDFNDPYDSGFIFDPLFGEDPVEDLLGLVSGIDKEFKESILCADDPLREFDSFVKARYAPGGNFDPGEAAKVSARRSEWQKKLSPEKITELNDSYRAPARVCSLSERLDSFPLWAHYADNHKGFVMEYDFRSLKFGDDLSNTLWPVRYSGVFDGNKLLRRSGPGDHVDSVISLLAALHKSPDWAYEKEWRVFAHQVGQLPDDSSVAAPLKAVYLGMNIPADKMQTVIENASIAGVPVFKMQLVRHEFRIEAVPLE